MNKSFFSLVVILSLALASCNNGGGQASQSTSKGETSVESTNATPNDSANKDATPGEQATSTQQANPANNGQVPQVGEAPKGKEANVKAPEMKVGNLPDAASKAAEKPKVPAKPETPTDKLIKQYNEAMLALIDASKTGGEAQEAAIKHFNEIKAQLEELDKNGKLNATQKDLFNVTNNAYNMLNSKQ